MPGKHPHILIVNPTSITCWINKPYVLILSEHLVTNACVFRGKVPSILERGGNKLPLSVVNIAQHGIRINDFASAIIEISVLM